MPDQTPAADADPHGRPFEEMYAAVGEDLEQLPWANLSPHPLLVAWLDESGTARAADAPAGLAVVVGCGLGDDAEELAARGYDVTAFDYSPTAISWCHRRFPRSQVDYQIANVLALPPQWQGRFDLVIEINTVQSLPPDQHDEAITTIAALVAPQGRLFVRCFGRDDDEPATGRPWPLSHAELRGFEAAGLREDDVFDEVSPVGDNRRVFRVVYSLPSP